MTKLTRNQLTHLLQRHRLWLDTAGALGSKADLCGLDLQGSDLRREKLQGVDLGGTNLQCSGLQDVNLQGANLEGANLQHTDLRGAVLRDANLQRSNLYGVSFYLSDLRGAKLDVGFRDCYNFHRAKFTSDALPWLILHPRWAEMKHTVQIEEI